MRPLETWEEVGTRVALARESNALTQTALASRAAMERTALAKVESGKRALSSLELARLATVLGRPIQWFVSESPPAVVSRRASLDGPSDDLDVVVDTFARDVELLIELGSLSPAHQVGDIGIPETLREVEDVARTARERTGEPDGPLTNLIAKVEALGLYAASIDLPGHATEGAYVALEGAGVAVINGAQDAGRRRFTLAHELGHHVFADEYATDWALAESRDEREKRINVFAIHFLMPRASITNDWGSTPRERRPSSSSDPACGRLSGQLDRSLHPAAESWPHRAGGGRRSAGEDADTGRLL